MKFAYEERIEELEGMLDKAIQQRHKYKIILDRTPEICRQALMIRFTNQQSSEIVADFIRLLKAEEKLK